MAFAFDIKKKGDGALIHLSGIPEKALWEMAEILELDDPWPVLPLMFNTFHNMLKANKISKEKLERLVIVDPDGTEGLALGDIEELRIAGKRLEMEGLGDE
jgi:hypothetical protein